MGKVLYGSVHPIHHSCSAIAKEKDIDSPNNVNCHKILKSSLLISLPYIVYEANQTMQLCSNPSRSEEVEIS